MKKAREKTFSSKQCSKQKLERQMTFKWVKRKKSSNRLNAHNNKYRFQISFQSVNSPFTNSREMNRHVNVFMQICLFQEFLFFVSLSPPLTRCPGVCSMLYVRCVETEKFLSLKATAQKKRRRKKFHCRNVMIIEHWAWMKK